MKILLDFIKGRVITQNPSTRAASALSMAIGIKEYNYRVIGDCIAGSILNSTINNDTVFGQLKIDDIRDFVNRYNYIVSDIDMSEFFHVDNIIYFVMDNLDMCTDVNLYDYVNTSLMGYIRNDNDSQLTKYPILENETFVLDNEELNRIFFGLYSVIDDIRYNLSLCYALDDAVGLSKHLMTNSLEGVSPYGIRYIRFFHNAIANGSIKVGELAGDKILADVISGLLK